MCVVDAVVKAIIAAKGSVLDKSHNKVAAYDFAQSPGAEQLALLQQQVCKLSSMTFGTQSLAAYQPTAR